MLEVDNERVVSADSERLPSFAIALALWIVERHADAPHFREQGDIGSHCARTSTEGVSFGKIRGLVTTAPSHLQQADSSQSHFHPIASSTVIETRLTWGRNAPPS